MQQFKAFIDEPGCSLEAVRTLSGIATPTTITNKIRQVQAAFGYTDPDGGLRDRPQRLTSAGLLTVTYIVSPQELSTVQTHLKHDGRFVRLGIHFKDAKNTPVDFSQTTYYLNCQRRRIGKQQVQVGAGAWMMVVVESFSFFGWTTGATTSNSNKNNGWYFTKE